MVASTERCAYRQLDGIWKNMIIHYGITTLQHLIDQGRMGLPKNTSLNVEKFLLYWFNLMLVKRGRRIHGMLYHMRNVRDLLANGKKPCERRFGEPF